MCGPVTEPKEFIYGTDMKAARVADPDCIYEMPNKWLVNSGHYYTWSYTVSYKDAKGKSGSCQLTRYSNKLGDDGRGVPAADAVGLPWKSYPKVVNITRIAEHTCSDAKTYTGETRSVQLSLDWYTAVK